MVREDITPEMQAEYNRQLKENAEKGWTYVKIVAYVNIGIAALGFLTGNHGILDTAISIIVSIFLIRGSAISRILFLISCVFSLFAEIILGLNLASLVHLTGINFKAVRIGMLLAFELAINVAILYLLFFNKNVDSFFRYLRNK